ncbi:MAG: DUF72 domain-containing protein [Chloroflexi bacterium]|nr:DUF72 domain-containing protein [Chloroflexota bacterium]
MAFYLGCPLWGLKSWVGRFFPPKTKPRDFLSAYSRRLNAVEGNTTFYGLPSADVVMRWRDATPAGFKFCLKLPQVISHHKQLRACQAETEAFVARLRLLGDRCGPALLQLPPSFGAKQLDQLRGWLEAWPADLRLAVEPRHADFFGAHEAELDGLLSQHHVARCTFDTAPLFSADPAQPEVAAAQARKPRWPARYTRTASFAFVRYVGHPDIQANQPWLMPWAARVGEWLARGDDVFFFVHHPDDTFAPDLARHFHSLVAARTAQASLDARWLTAQPPLI